MKDGVLWVEHVVGKATLTFGPLGGRRIILIHTHPITNSRGSSYIQSTATPCEMLGSPDAWICGAALKNTPRRLPPLQLLLRPLRLRRPGSLHEPAQQQGRRIFLDHHKGVGSNGARNMPDRGVDMEGRVLKLGGISHAFVRNPN